jgi:hypothetical protein
MTKDALSFLYVCAGALGIKTPVDVRIAQHRPKAVNDAAAICEVRYRKDKISRFVIFVYLVPALENKYPLNDILAHELAHAKMIEAGRFNEKHHHDKRFQKLCRVLEKEMPKMGFPLGKLYNPKTDTD